MHFFATKADLKAIANEKAKQTEKLHICTDRERFTLVTCTYQEKHCSRDYKLYF